MPDIKFKLDEGVLGAIGKELGKLALAPLLGSSEEAKKMFDKIDEIVNKRGFYAAEKEVLKNQKNLVDGYVQLLKKVEVIGKVGFAKEPFNESELDVLESVIKKFIDDKIKEYREEIKKSIKYKSKPPEPDFTKASTIREFNKILNKEIQSKYKSDNNEYYRLNKWAKEGMKVVGTTLPRLVFKGIENIAKQWVRVEQLGDKVK